MHHNITISQRAHPCHWVSATGQEGMDLTGAGHR